MTSKNALSRRQFQASGFDDSAYEFNFQPGEFTGTIDCKRWGKGKKLVTYMDAIFRRLLTHCFCTEIR